MSLSEAHGTQRLTQVRVDFQVTNITQEPVLMTRGILCYRLPRLFSREVEVEGDVPVQHPHDNLYGSYPVLPRATAQVSGMWLIAPALDEKQCSPLHARVCVVDQFGNRHFSPWLELGFAGGPYHHVL